MPSVYLHVASLGWVCVYFCSLHRASRLSSWNGPHHDSSFFCCSVACVSVSCWTGQRELKCIVVKEVDSGRKVEIWDPKIWELETWLERLSLVMVYVSRMAQVPFSLVNSMFSLHILSPVPPIVISNNHHHYLHLDHIRRVQLKPLVQSAICTD